MEETDLIIGVILVTKVCPKCKTENLDSSGFCQECGERLNEPVKVPQKNKEPNRFDKWWNKQSTGRKVLYTGLIFFVCLIAVFSIVLLSWENTAKINNYQGPGETIQIQIDYSGSWNGFVAYNDNTTKRSILKLNGTGPKTVNLTGYVTDMAYNFNKLDNNSETLKVTLLGNGTIINSTNTSDAEGTVDIDWNVLTGYKKN